MPKPDFQEKKHKTYIYQVHSFILSFHLTWWRGGDWGGNRLRSDQTCLSLSALFHGYFSLLSSSFYHEEQATQQRNLISTARTAGYLY